MLEWRDEGAVLSMRPHGETAAIIEVFTAQHGRHAGVVRGGTSRRMAAALQPGSQVAVAWKARLDGHMGAFSVEPLRSRAAVLADRLALAGLSATCALLRAALPEREPHVSLWQGSMVLLDALAEGGDWPALYLRWEMQLLEELGFGLDLSRCAVTGSRDDLAFVSPKTGRAVSRQGAGDWAERLLPLPQGLLGQGPVSRAELAQGLAITGHFLNRELSPLMDGKPLPEARGRLLDRFAKA
ncbi:MAG: DNA repair protein RecO [Rhodobacteraceae bacterium PARR1]|nr:MAG: DNA repair protein RecO [Rhodobacteraceae bacterium PARR1]